MNTGRGTAALILLAGLAGLAAEASGQTLDSIPLLSAPPERARLLMELRAGGAHLGNFLQAPAGEPKKNVLSGTSEVRMRLPLDRWHMEIHGGVAGTLYGQFNPSYALSTGAEWRERIHRVEGNASFRARSPRVEVGDTLGFADVLVASASYAIRPVRAIQLTALAEIDRQSYDRSKERENHALQVGIAARYFGFGYRLSPEIGAAAGSREVRLDEEDYDERVLWVTLRSAPTPQVYLSLRYRNRWREYTSQIPASSNLRREDDRKDLTFSLDVSLNDRWAWTAYLSHQDADSTKDSRIFRTRYLSTGLTYRLR